MKKQINPTTKAHLIRSAFYLLLLLGVCAIPFTLAQRNAGKGSTANPSTLLPSSLKPAESQLQIPVAANADLQVASSKEGDVTKMAEAPAMENPDPEDVTYRPAESAALASAGLKD